MSPTGSAVSVLGGLVLAAVLAIVAAAQGWPVLAVVLALVALGLVVVLGLVLVLGPRPRALVMTGREAVDTPAPPRPPVPSEPTPRIPDALDGQALGAALGVRLAGTPADGSPAPDGPPPGAVVWVDHGDELLVHLDRLQVRFVDRLAVVAVDVETDQTGRATMILPFAFGDPDDPAGLVAVTEEYPRGDARVAARWGAVLREAMWSALLDLASDHASERHAAPRGLAVDANALRLVAGPAILGAGGVRP